MIYTSYIYAYIDTHRERMCDGTTRTQMGASESTTSAIFHEMANMTNTATAKLKRQCTPWNLPTKHD